VSTLPVAGSVIVSIAGAVPMTNSTIASVAGSTFGDIRFGFTMSASLKDEFGVRYWVNLMPGRSGSTNTTESMGGGGPPPAVIFWFALLMVLSILLVICDVLSLLAATITPSPRKSSKRAA